MIVSEGISKEFLSIHFDGQKNEEKDVSVSLSLSVRPTGFYYKDVPLSMARRRLILRTYPSLSHAHCRVALSAGLGSMLPYYLEDYGLTDIVRIDDPNPADEEFIDFRGMRHILSTLPYCHAIRLITYMPNLSLMRIMPLGSDKNLCRHLDRLIEIERVRKPGQKIRSMDLTKQDHLFVPVIR